LTKFKKSFIRLANDFNNNQAIYWLKLPHLKMYLTLWVEFHHKQLVAFKASLYVLFDKVISDSVFTIYGLYYKNITIVNDG